MRQGAFWCSPKRWYERYKRCVECGRKILWFRTFCPYCYGYQGKTNSA